MSECKTAVILAAGAGHRLKPLTDGTPKCLLDVGGKPIIKWQIDALLKYGINKIYVVTGFKHQDIVSALKEYEVTFIHNHEWHNSNNIYSLILALDNGLEDNFLLLNGDTMFHHGVIKKLVGSDFDNSMAVVRKKTEAEDMKVKIDKNGRVVAIGKELQDSWREFMGIMRFDLPKKVILYFMQQRNRQDWFEHGIADMIQQFTFHAIDVTNYPCIEIDFKEDLDLAREMFHKDAAPWDIGIRRTLDVNEEKACHLLFNLIDTLEKFNIKYWFNWGLLLGIVRDNHFIPWDTDMDVTCHWEDRDKVLELVEPVMKQRGCYIPEVSECFPEDRWYIRDMEKIELNFVEDCGDKYVYSPNRCKLACPKKYIDELSFCYFRGRRVPIPSYVKEYLALSYGHDWHKPIKGKKPVSL